MPTTTEISNYLKIAGASIYAFDYLQTLPDEYKFYRRQPGFLRLSLACWLFIAVRYLGMLAILLVLVGGFSTSFTQKTCEDFFLSVPIAKARIYHLAVIINVLAAAASHFVFIYRTYAICGRDRKMLYFLLVVGIILSAAEIISPVVVPRNALLGKTGNCVSDIHKVQSIVKRGLRQLNNTLNKGTTSWIQYLCMVIFDVIILVITGRQLFGGFRSDFMKFLWENQVVYFLAVTVVNIVNLVWFIVHSHDTQATMFATLGMAVTAIFSARVILDPMRVGGSAPNTSVSSGPRAYSNGPLRFGVVDPELGSTATDHRMTRVRPVESIQIQKDIFEVVDREDDWPAKVPPSPRSVVNVYQPSPALSLNRISAIASLERWIMGFCRDCIRCVVHEGIPRGKWERISEVDCYVGTPEGEYPRDKVLLYLADIFGPQLANAQLPVDSFADNGFKTIAPDHLNSDPIPADVMIGLSLEDIELLGMLIRYLYPRKTLISRSEQTRPPLDKVIAALKKEGVTAFGATGYCFGGRYVFDLAFDNIITAGTVSHPSLLKQYVSTSKARLLINSCTIDKVFPPEAQAEADEVSKDFVPGYKREYFDGCVHGFAVRGDSTDPQVKAGREGAFKSIVKWMIEYL
ncbi:hypothetical protein VNI00_006671 [Paramarasmius palmivorus]|uniref:Dienelactone hydrolase domain-containing protein n=1 Tax=Paramarasmius palmivorus TaxID=297713 RepID=A0AAW0D755_9AGAR